MSGYNFNYVDKVGMIGMNAQEVQSVDEIKILVESANLKSDCFNILCLNVRSINCNFDQFIKITEELPEKIDILIFSEAWLFKNNFSENAFKIKGFHKFFIMNNENQNNGVAVLTGETHDCETNELTQMRTGTGCEIKVKIDNTCLTVFAFYRPPELPMWDFEKTPSFLGVLDHALQ